MGFTLFPQSTSYKLELLRAWQRGEAADDLILTNCSFRAREKTGARAGVGVGVALEAQTVLFQSVSWSSRETPCGSPDPACHCASCCPSVGSFLQEKKSWRRDREAKP